MTTVSEIGERNLIGLIMKQLPKIKELTFPPWEDASAISIGNGKVLVVNTDMLVWETDIPKGMTPLQAGRKSVVMTISDLGARGVKPLAFMASIAIPRDYPVSKVEEIAKGFAKGVKEYGIFMIGGDTNEAKDVILNGVAFGIKEKAGLMNRYGAKPGNILATTGTFGKTSAALKILLEDYDSPKKIRKNLVDSVFFPKARVKEGIALAESGVVTSCIDSSDGLSVSLYDLQKSTGLGYKVTNIPIPNEVKEFANKYELNPVDLALFGGEEYELLFTFKRNHIKKAKKALNQVECELHIIGEVVSEKRIWYDFDGVSIDIPMNGWNHFTR